jgi:endogenous inhibitor of DNA gyrase (YacG/DUF329 family)
MIVNKSKTCAKCGKEVSMTFGYRYCDQCGVIFYTCCDSYSYCPSCGRQVEQFKGNGTVVF